MTAAGQDGERLITGAMVRKARATRLRSAASEGTFVNPIDHDRAALAAVAPDIAADAERRVLGRCAAELQAERDRPVLNPLRIDVLIGRWSGRAPAGDGASHVACGIGPGGVSHAGPCQPTDDEPRRR